MPAPKAKLQALAAQLITSRFAEKQRHRLHETRARWRGEHPHADVYLRIDDPYSYLLLQAINALGKDVVLPLRPHVLTRVPDALYPEYDRLQHYAFTDAKRLARQFGLYFPEKWQQPPAAHLTMTAASLLVAAENDAAFFDTARAVLDLYWRGDEKRLQQYAERLPGIPTGTLQFMMQERADALFAAGHYLSATLHYAGEWYWGVDRLHYFLARVGSAATAHWRKPLLTPLPRASELTPAIDFYFSFRSPYSYLCLKPLMHYVQENQLTLNIKPVLPMVMRGMAVPKEKRLYILLDAAREARLRGIPFGKIVDPVGVGVERCMAVFEYAAHEQRGLDYLLSVATGIWAEGADVAHDSGLRPLVERAGLHWDIAQGFLQREHWRHWAELHREDLLDTGLWGVPSFSCKGKHYWGQDRLWALAADCAASAT